MSELTIIQVIEMELCRLDFSDEQIVSIFFKKNAHVPAKYSDEIHANIRTVFTDEYGILVCAEEGVTYDAKLRDNFAERKTGSLADAMMVKRLAEKILGNFYIRVNNPVIPTKIFIKEEDAIDWLRERIKLQE